MTYIFKEITVPVETKIIFFSSLCWIFPMGMGCAVVLHFLVVFHTSNSCDRAFCHVKRHINRCNVQLRRDMIQLIDVIARSNMTLRGKNVTWVNWKVLLSFFFCPSTFSIPTYQFFSLWAANSGRYKGKSIYWWELGVSTTFLKRSLISILVWSSRESSLSTGAYGVISSPMSELPSQQERSRLGYLVKFVREEPCRQ